MRPGNTYEGNAPTVPGEGAGRAAGSGASPAEKGVVRVVQLKDGVMVQVPLEDLLSHVEEMLQRKINLLNWLIEQSDSMPRDTLKRYLEDMRVSLEKLKLNVKARALIFSEFAWAWISYLWIINGKTIQEICVRAKTMSDIKRELEEKGYVDIFKGENL